MKYHNLHDVVYNIKEIIEIRKCILWDVFTFTQRGRFSRYMYKKPVFALQLLMVTEFMATTGEVVHVSPL